MSIQKKELITIAFLLGCLVLAGASKANEDKPWDQGHELTGFFLGANAGFGSNCTGWTQGDLDISKEGQDGVLGGFRVGYAFSPKLALSFEAYGLGWESTDATKEDLGVGAGLVALTWHPVGHGFFVRAGLGGGGGDFQHPVNGSKVTIEDRGAAMFSLGYDWRIGRNTTLGLSADGFVIDAGGATGFEDDYVGGGGLTLQFNWHL